MQESDPSHAPQKQEKNKPNNTNQTTELVNKNRGIRRCSSMIGLSNLVIDADQLFASRRISKSLSGPDPIDVSIGEKWDAPQFFVSDDEEVFASSNSTKSEYEEYVPFSMQI